MQPLIKLVRYSNFLLVGLFRLIKLNFFPRWLRRISHLMALAIIAVYLSLYCIVAYHAYDFLANPPTEKADAALILGNRAYFNGAPNPTLTGRVDEGVRLAKLGLVNTLVMTGGVDVEDGRIESAVMTAHAIKIGFKGNVLQESQASSTQENFQFSRPILLRAGIKKVIVVSEPYHLWRAKKLVDAGQLGQEFEVQYAAASNPMWEKWGMLFKGALREPLAIINNYAKGYF
jgi:uncharacterized SAM-binding protein YcdF (DUF218 family)